MLIRTYFLDTELKLFHFIGQLPLDDPLWDGDGCPADNNCCANAGLPWFCKTLPTEVKEDIEVRLCCEENPGNENIGVELLEILVY